jgi:hypothetical protein
MAPPKADRIRDGARQRDAAPIGTHNSRRFTIIAPRVYQRSHEEVEVYRIPVSG